jgi:hypothetical protein
MKSGDQYIMKMPLRRSAVYPLCLLLGASLVTAAALAHPRLAGDGAAQLEMIAAAPRWAAIHWTFLFAFPLSIAGLLGVVGVHIGTPGEPAARAGLLVGGFGYACWMIVVAFMLGAGGALAGAYAAGEPGLAATRAVFLYDMLHPFALTAQRAGAFALGLATCFFGWGGWLGGGRLPRWTAALALAGGAAGAALALAAPATSRLDEAAFVPPVLWQLATALVLLLRPQADELRRPA